MVPPSLHPCQLSPIARPADKPPRWIWLGTSPGRAGISPGPGKPPARPPLAQQQSVNGAHLCYEMQEPRALPEDGGAGEGTRACGWGQGQVKPCCRGIGRNQAEQGSPDASGMVECPAITRVFVGHPRVTEARVAGATQDLSLHVPEPGGGAGGHWHCPLLPSLG